MENEAFRIETKNNLFKIMEFHDDQIDREFSRYADMMTIMKATTAFMRRKVMPAPFNSS